MLEPRDEFFRETVCVAEHVTHQTRDFAQGSSDQEPNNLFFFNVEILGLKYFKKQFLFPV